MRKLIKEKLVEFKQDLGEYKEEFVRVDKDFLMNILEHAIEHANTVETKPDGEEKFKMEVLDPDTFVYKYQLESDVSEWIVELVRKELNLHISYDVSFTHLPPMIDDDGTVFFEVYSTKKDVKAPIRYKHIITIETFEGD